MESIFIFMRIFRMFIHGAASALPGCVLGEEEIRVIGQLGTAQALQPHVVLPVEPLDLGVAGPDVPG